ncbi:MAG: hypothetical protein HS100_19135 [Anaerolineales bacterium]|nr:hypothetical protein [Anaerolineales bacterium]
MPTSLSIFAFIASIKFGSPVSTGMERYLREVVEPLNAGEYQRQYEAQQIKYLRKKAAKFGFQLVPV